MDTFEGFSSESAFRQFHFGASFNWGYNCNQNLVQEKIREMDDWLFATLGEATYVPPANVYAKAFVHDDSWGKEHMNGGPWSIYGFMKKSHLIAFKLRFG